MNVNVGLLSGVSAAGPNRRQRRPNRPPKLHIERVELRANNDIIIYPQQRSCWSGNNIDYWASYSLRIHKGTFQCKQMHMMDRVVTSDVAGNQNVHFVLRNEDTRASTIFGNHLGPVYVSVVIMQRNTVMNGSYFSDSVWSDSTPWRLMLPEPQPVPPFVRRLREPRRQQDDEMSIDNDLHPREASADYSDASAHDPSSPSPANSPNVNRVSDRFDALTDDEDDANQLLAGFVDSADDFTANTVNDLGWDIGSEHIRDDLVIRKDQLDKTSQVLEEFDDDQEELSMKALLDIDCILHHEQDDQCNFEWKEIQDKSKRYYQQSLEYYQAIEAKLGRLRLEVATFESKFDCVKPWKEWFESTSESVGDMLSKYTLIRERMDEPLAAVKNDWKNWNYKKMCDWFQYCLRQNKRNISAINWNDIEFKLRTRELHGNFLMICEKSELQRLGFASDDDLMILELAITRLTKADSQNKRIARIEEEQEQGTNCSVCLTQKVSYVLLPCGHACLCDGCVQRVDLSRGCPICRKSVSQTSKFFL